MAINYPQRYDDDFLNTIKTVIDHVNEYGKTIQDLVADGQLTEEQYAELLTTINGLVKSGHVDKSDLTSEFKDEIEGFSTQLAQKANQDKVKMDLNLKRDKSIPIGLNDASSELLSAISGGEGATFNIQSTPRNYSVHPKKTDFIRLSSNLYNYKTDIRGYEIDSNTGELTERSGRNVTDIINCESNTSYTFKNFIQVFYYNESMELIGSKSLEPNGVVTDETPENATFMRVEHQANISSSKMLQINEGNTLLDFEEFYQELDEVTPKKESITSDYFDKRIGLNMYPFHKRAIIHEDKEIALSILEAIKDVKLYNADPNDNYHFSEITRRFSSGDQVMEIGISNGTNEVCRVYHRESDPVNGLIEIELISQNDSAITGIVTINTSKLAERIDPSTLNYDSVGLDLMTYLNTTPIEEDEETEATIIPDNKYPFLDTATFKLGQSSSVTEEKVKGIIEVFKDIKLYGTKRGEKYYISSLRKGVSSSTGREVYQIDISQGDNVVCNYGGTADNLGEELNNYAKIYFNSRNDSSVTGYAIINWSMLGDLTYERYDLLYEDAPLDPRTYIATDASKSYSGNTWNIEDFHWDNIEARYGDIVSLQDTDSISFTVVTDSHIRYDEVSTKSSLEAISAMSEYYGVDFVAGLGDYIVGDLSKEESLKLINQNLISAGKYTKAPLLFIKGNHDSNPFVTENFPVEEQEEHIIYNKDFYQVVGKSNEKYGIVTDEDTPYSTYFYKDFDRQKVRVVCLDSWEMKEGELHSTWNGVNSPNQLKWLVEKGLNFEEKENPNEWATVILSHIPQVRTEVNHDYGVHSVHLDTVLHDFMTGNQGSISPNDIQVSYDFRSQGEMQLVGLFHGHVHEDSHQQIDGINYFISNSVSANKRWETSLPRQQFSSATLSANTVIINRKTRTVNVIKTGVGEDYEFNW